MMKPSHKCLTYFRNFWRYHQLWTWYKLWHFSERDTTFTADCGLSTGGDDVHLKQAGFSRVHQGALTEAAASERGRLQPHGRTDQGRSTRNSCTNTAVGGAVWWSKTTFLCTWKVVQSPLTQFCNHTINCFHVLVFYRCWHLELHEVINVVWKCECPNKGNTCMCCVVLDPRE